MRFEDEYTTAEKAQKDTKEAGKIILSNDVFAQCALLQQIAFALADLINLARRGK